MMFLSGQLVPSGFLPPRSMPSSARKRAPKKWESSAPERWAIAIAELSRGSTPRVASLMARSNASVIERAASCPTVGPSSTWKSRSLRPAYWPPCTV